MSKYWGPAVVAAFVLSIGLPRSHALQVVAVLEPLEKVTVGGKLTRAEYADIRRLVARHGVSKSITRIEVMSPGKVKVQANDRKPLSGGGSIMQFQRQGVRWNVRILEEWDQ